MENIQERILKLRQTTHTQQKDLAAAIGVSAACLSLWEKGQRKIDIGHARMIADYFNVSIDYLLGTNPELTEEEQQLIDLIKGLDDEQVKELSNYVDYLLSKRK